MIPPTPHDERDIPAPRTRLTSLTSMSARRDMPRAVAVVSDGSGLFSWQRSGDQDTSQNPDQGTAPASLGTWLDDDAAVIHQATGVPVRAVPLFACDAEDLAAQMCALTADAGAIFLTRTDPDRARAVQQALHDVGGPPVVIDADTTAISLTAALLTALARAGREPGTSRVVIAGAATLPELSPLLIAVGVGDISSWNASDAHVFPLHHLARHVTAVIDLLGATAHPAGPVADPFWPTVISADDPSHRLAPAPGLLHALAEYPDAVLDIDVARVAALAMTAATPLDQLAASVADPRRLAEAITATVLRALTPHAASGYYGSPPGND